MLNIKLFINFNGNQNFFINGFKNIWTFGVVFLLYIQYTFRMANYKFINIPIKIVLNIIQVNKI